LARRHQKNQRQQRQRHHHRAVAAIGDKDPNRLQLYRRAIALLRRHDDRSRALADIAASTTHPLGDSEVGTQMRLVEHRA